MKYESKYLGVEVYSDPEVPVDMVIGSSGDREWFMRYFMVRTKIKGRCEMDVGISFAVGMAVGGVAVWAILDHKLTVLREAMVWKDRRIAAMKMAHGYVVGVDRAIE